MGMACASGDDGDDGGRDDNLKLLHTSELDACVGFAKSSCRNDIEPNCFGMLS